MVNGIEHVAVVSKNTAALKDWYMEMYGLRPPRQRRLRRRRQQQRRLPRRQRLPTRRK